MCNTWRNVFLQSMKNNTLSVKKLMKNLILRTLRQLYAVSEIIILIRWVTPPQKVENLQFEFFLSFEILQFFKFFNFAKSSLFPSFIFIGYIYMSLCPLQHSLIAISSNWFSAKWMWSDPSPLCYTQPNLFTNSSCEFYLKLVQNLHCVLSAEEIANGTLKPILSKFSVLPLKPFRIPRYTYPFTHDHTRSPPLSTWVTHVKRMRRVRGTFVQFLWANNFSPWL